MVLGDELLATFRPADCNNAYDRAVKQEAGTVQPPIGWDAASGGETVIAAALSEAAGFEYELAVVVGEFCVAM